MKIVDSHCATLIGDRPSHIFVVSFLVSTTLYIWQAWHKASVDLSYAKKNENTILELYKIFKGQGQATGRPCLLSINEQQWS